ncbi:MAG: RusA family crossover junction endodeoxyribonuclease [Candidatus Marinimicrobia bacterium]|nr:RusA family crossover junction endodeoxyribonuclease [Candidatus Neomarinimicrobiota bacterium]
MKIIVYGDPKAQKRPRFSRRGKFVTTYDPSKSDKDNFLCQVIQNRPDQPLDCPLSISCKFYFPIPKSISKVKRQSMMADCFPVTTRPDLDNLEKFVLDSLSGIYFKDDSQIFALSSSKFYSVTPRTEIEIDDARF